MKRGILKTDSLLLSICEGTRNGKITVKQQSSNFEIPWCEFFCSRPTTAAIAYSASFQFKFEIRIAFVLVF